jgi:hypothetical protein
LPLLLQRRLLMPQALIQLQLLLRLRLWLRWRRRLQPRTLLLLLLQGGSSLTLVLCSARVHW